MRAALSLRVSSGKQRDAATIDIQRAAGMALIASRGWTFIGEYVDDGVSAKAGNLARRPGLRRLLDDAEARRFDVVIVYDASRLTRAENQQERGLIIGTLQLAGVRLCYASTGELIDTASEEGDFRTTLDTLFAAKDNRLRRARAIAGRARAALAGRAPTKPPFGLAYDRAARAWGEIPVEAAAVREIFRRAAAGESCAVIAGALNRAGAPVPQAKRWASDGVVRIVRRECYWTGLWRASGEAVVAVQPLVAPELAEAALGHLAKRVNAPPRTTRYPYLLEGLGTCALCGGRICISTSYGRTGGATKFRYYACANRIRCGERGRDRCPLPFHRVEATDAAVWAAVQRELANDALVRQGLELVGGAASVAGRAALADLEEARRKLAAQEEAARAVTLALEAGHLSADIYAERIGVIGRRRQLLAQQIATWSEAASEAQREVVVAERFAATLGEVRARALVATAEERRAIAQLLCRDGLIVGEREIEGVWRCDPAFGGARPSERPIAPGGRLLVALSRTK